MLHIRKDGEGKISQALFFRTSGQTGYHFFLNALYNAFTTLKTIGEVYPKMMGVIT